MVHAYHGGGASSARRDVVGKDNFIMMDDFVQDTVNDGVTMMRIMARRFWRNPKDTKLVDDFINHLDSDDLLYETPRWLDNFKDMKKTAKDLIYKDCPKE